MSPGHPKADCEVCCQDLATQIGKYLSAVGNAYDQDPEQMSVFILCLLEMGPNGQMCDDHVSFAEVKDYHPWRKPELFDVLLSHVGDTLSGFDVSSFVFMIPGNELEVIQ